MGSVGRDCDDNNNDDPRSIIVTQYYNDINRVHGILILRTGDLPNPIRPRNESYKYMLCVCVCVRVWYSIICVSSAIDIFLGARVSTKYTYLK